MRPKTSLIIKAIKKYRQLKRSEKSILDLIEFDQNSNQRLYRRIHKNFKSVVIIRKKIKSLEQSKFGKYLKKSPKVILLLNLGAIFKCEDSVKMLDDYLG